MIAAVIMLMPIVGCKKDDVPSRQSEYSLMSKDVLGVTGTATIIETSSTSATINIEISGEDAGTHPAQLCMNSVAEGGNVVINLNPVDESGKSSTLVTSKTYAQLIEFDGFIKVVESSAEPLVILAQGDIGGNVITSTNISYTLDAIGVFGVSGTALFEKRVNGNTLVTISVEGTLPTDVYPATINLGSIETVGAMTVTKTLSNVDGATGKSYTNIKSLNNGIDIIYDNWLVYDGYINIYQNSVSLDNIICHGNIGSNK